MNVKKTAIAAVSYAMVAALAIGGTLAYQTDQTPTAKNVMLSGDVSIAQYEYQRADKTKHTNEAGTGAKKGDLVPFVQEQMILPAVPKNNLGSDYTAEPTNLFYWGDYSAGGNGLWDDSKLSNVIDKFVFVENTGKAPAYYRTVLAFECPEGTEYGEGASNGEEFMMNVNGHSNFTWKEHGYTTIDGTRYLLMTATYEVALESGETSRPSLLQVVMTHNATNETVKAIGDEYTILVVSQAVQIDSGYTAGEMLDRAFGEITTTSHPWTDAISVESEEEFEQAISSDEEQIEIFLKDGEYTTNLEIPGGKDITIFGSKDVVLSGQIATTSSNAGTLRLNGVTVKVDNTIEDSTGISQTSKSAIAVWGNQHVICENVTFDMSLSDSTAITSWWSTGEGTTIELRNCTFNCNGQRPIRSDANVTIENCTFNDPYRYAVQMTSKASTATLLENAVVNFNNNTIVNGPNGKSFVYGVQLEGSDYGCSNLIINGSGNEIVDGGTESAMYYCECGKVDHTTVVFNTEVAAVHKP